MEKYGTAVQATVGNIIRRMRLPCSVTSVTGTHLPYTMIIAFGYMTALNVTLDLHCYRVKNSRISILIKSTIHAVTLPFRYSQRYKQRNLSSVI